MPESLLDTVHFGDIRNFPAELLDGIDAVVHLAAISNDPMGKTFEAVTEAINEKASIALASVKLPHGAAGDELWAEIYYQKELKWSRVNARCRVLKGPFFDPPRRRQTPAPDR